MSNNKSVWGWWFAMAEDDGRVLLPRGDGREVRAGEVLSVPGPTVLCKRGLHASERAIDALAYAPGVIVCRVRLSGDIKREDDKIVGLEREVLWMADAGVALRLFACDCADAALSAERAAGREPDSRLWEAVRVARLYAIGQASEEERSAAGSAAESAQNKMLEERLSALDNSPRSN